MPHESPWRIWLNVRSCQLQAAVASQSEYAQLGDFSDHKKPFLEASLAQQCLMFGECVLGDLSMWGCLDAPVQ